MRPLAITALLWNALVWGCVWWPFRRLHAEGLHPLWTTALVFGIAAMVIIVLRPGAILQVVRSPALWVLLLASGTTNASFNWAVVIGDVVRVVLLFYLMPLWAVFLARLLLGERLSAGAALRVVLGVAGAMIVLWPTPSANASAWPLPQTLADWLGVLGGLSFALNNVMLRREAAQPEASRALAMFIGGALVAAVLASVLTVADPALRPPAPSLGWIAMVLGLSAVFLTSNLALQYGAARLPANLTAVVMLTEVLFAAASSVAYGGGTLTLQVVAGGLLIVGGAVAAAFSGRPARP